MINEYEYKIYFVHWRIYIGTSDAGVAAGQD